MKLSNTLTRTIVALIGIPFIVAACYFGKILFLIFALIVGILSFREFSVMALNKSAKVNNLAGFAAVAVLITNSYWHYLTAEEFLLIFIPFLLLYELFRNRESAIINLGATLLAVFYIGLFSSSLVGIREFFNENSILYEQGGYLIISMMASIWVCDSSAFFIGSAIGRHKMFPRVSPKKSWEGAIAGFVFSVAAMIAARSLVLDFLSLNDVIIIGIIVGIFGQIGDLIESLVKRDAQVKDSSNLIPGHGGIFDRFDSLLYTSPLVFLYLHFFVR